MANAERSQSGSLLIVPVGIEINVLSFLINIFVSLLIVPVGIEMRVISLFNHSFLNF